MKQTLLSIMIHFLFQIINFGHVYDWHSHTKRANKLGPKNVGIAVKSCVPLNVPLIVVVVGDRKTKISRNKVDGNVQNCLRPVCDYK